MYGQIAIHYDHSLFLTRYTFLTCLCFHPYIPQFLSMFLSQEEEKQFNAVMEQIMSELKVIMRRDLQKKMVENSAFKSFESWWDYEDKTMKVGREFIAYIY